MCDLVGGNTHSLGLASHFLRLSGSCRRLQMGCPGLKGKKMERVSQMCAFIFEHDMWRLSILHYLMLNLWRYNIFTCVCNVEVSSGENKERKRHPRSVVCQRVNSLLIRFM